MSFCGFAEGAAMFDATPIENMFLLEYMYDAPASALRVYLYARMAALHPELCGGISELAHALRMDEEEAYEAFAYWERRGLARRVADRPPAYELIPLGAQGGGGASAMEREMYANRDFNNGLQKLFGEKLIEDHELRKAADWRNILHFDQDAVLRMVAYGIETSRSRDPKPPSVFKRVDELAEKWSARGVHTLEDVERAIADESGVYQATREVLRFFGLKRQPTVPELNAVRRWTGEWGFTQEQMLEIFEKETKKTRTPTFAYLEAILQSRASGENADRQGLVEALKELDPLNGPPTQDQLDSYRKLLGEGFAPETIRLAAVQCHRKRRYQFGDLEWMLSEWRKAGVRTPEQAEAYVRQMRQATSQLRGMLKKAGSDRRPNYGEIETYMAWKDRYPAELIDFAAECARNAGGSMAYMEKLLTAWSEQGVATREAARAQHEAFKAAQAAQGAQGVQGAQASPGAAMDYAQREYRDEDFGDDFFVDLSQYAEEDEA